MATKNTTPNDKEKNIIKNVKVEKISVMILGKPGSPPQQLTSDMIIYNNKNTTVLLEKLPFITGSIKYNEKLLLSYLNKGNTVISKDTFTSISLYL